MYFFFVGAKFLKGRSNRAHSEGHFARTVERVYTVHLRRLYGAAKNLKAELALRPDGSAPSSVVDRFVDILFPRERKSTAGMEVEVEALDRNSTQRSKKKSREPHKDIFNAWQAYAQRLSYLVDKYGWPILLILPKELTDKKWALRQTAHVVVLANVYVVCGP